MISLAHLRYEKPVFLLEFIYKEKDFYDKTQEEKELLGMSMKESKKQKDERTPSEKLQDDLEPIPMPCPMHEDYD